MTTRSSSPLLLLALLACQRGPDELIEGMTRDKTVEVLSGIFSADGVAAMHYLETFASRRPDLPAMAEGDDLPGIEDDVALTLGDCVAIDKSLEGGALSYIADYDGCTDGQSGRVDVLEELVLADDLSSLTERLELSLYDYRTEWMGWQGLVSWETSMTPEERVPTSFAELADVRLTVPLGEDAGVPVEVRLDLVQELAVELTERGVSLSGDGDLSLEGVGGTFALEADWSEDACEGGGWDSGVLTLRLGGQDLSLDLTCSSSSSMAKSVPASWPPSTYGGWWDSIYAQAREKNDVSDCVQCDLSGADLSGRNMFGVILAESNLTDAKLTDAHAWRLICTRTNLTRADLSDADLQEAELQEANLTSARILRSDMRWADLSDADLTDATLTGTSLKYARLEGANLTNTDFSAVNLLGVRMQGATVQGAHLGGADLTDVHGRELVGQPADLPTGWAVIGGFLLGPGAQLELANLSDLDLSGQNLANADLESATLRRTNLSATNMAGANLGAADAREANLTAATLLGANLSAAELGGANLTYANLTNANLQLAELQGAVLRASLPGADLRGADLTNADAVYAYMPNANLADANLTGANLSGATLSGANLTGVRWANTTCPDGSNSDANGGSCARNL